MKKHYRKEDDCLNCGTKLEGKFCHNCGQENLQIKESFGHMMNHAISDYFHFDHQFFHTLKPLFLNPGKLTNEYMAGHRAQYLHPVKMYIFISVVYFLLLFQSGFEPVTVKHNNNKAETKQEVETANKQLDNVAKDPNISSYAKKAILLGKKANEQRLKNQDTTDNDGSSTFINPISDDTTYQQYITSQQKLPKAERDNFFMRIYNKKAFVYKQKYGSRAKEVFIDELKHNIPKMMFLMLPLCALILKVAFWKNKKYYVEHLIYTFHLHCFLFIFLAIIMLLQMIFPAEWHINGWLNFIATVGIIWYVYRSLRVVYQRSRWRTVFKIIGASLMYFIVFTICFCGVLIITAVTMS